MFNTLKNKALKSVLFALLLTILILQSCAVTFYGVAKAMPFYDLQPKQIVLRAKFSTDYSKSSEERKSNVALAARSLNNVFVDVGAEFSFNRTVGERTVKRGYKPAKIIVNGEFVDGIGGGVCQVSTTLYNAVLLAGLNVIEYHPHSLPVGYVAPSFDAMVNSGWADLKFINGTHNPIILKTFADGQSLRVEVYGEKLTETYERKSMITESIPSPEDKIIYDDNGEYPDLLAGEKRFLRYGKAGYKSEGYLVVSKNGKVIRSQKIRSDKYNATRGLVVIGTAVKEENIEDLGV